MNLSPSRSSTQGVTGSIAVSERVGADFLECPVLREPLQRAPRREDQAGLAALLALQDLRRPTARRRRRIRPRSRCGCQSPARRPGDEEQRVEPPHGVEFRHPARERRQRRSVDAAASVGQRCREAACRRRDRAEASARSRGWGSGRRPTGIAVSSIVSRIAATARGVTFRARRASCAVGCVDPPAGEHQRAGGERHAFGALDHQELGRAVRAGRGPGSGSPQGSPRLAHAPHLGGGGQRKSRPERCRAALSKLPSRLTCR